MIFEHANFKKKKGAFFIDEKIRATANSVLNKTVLKDFWNGYTFHRSSLAIEHSSEINFIIGNPKRISLENYSYAINVDNEGVYITANDEKNLIYGFITLLDCIDTDDDGHLKIDCCEIFDKPIIGNRMIHFCVFPNTELWEFKRFVRLCGALKYSHIIVEFWGMLKFDCLRELSWENGLTKESVKPIIEDANDLGMEIIPMFNHWGHASQSRVMHGKHVVLDQNPKLHYLFGNDGWRWNIKNKDTRVLFKNIREELTELCGKGNFFHIGCDEAYGFNYKKSEINDICAFINEVSDELEKNGRKTIMWADMLLHNNENYNKNNSYFAAAPSESAAEYFTENLNKTIITADWQYKCKKAPVETSLKLKECGFETLICSWDRSIEESMACINTAKDNDLFGILHTTWHTLSEGCWYITKIAKECWNSENKMVPDCYVTETASLMRKIYFAEGDYNKAGWGRYDVGVVW